MRWLARAVALVGCVLSTYLVAALLGGLFKAPGEKFGQGAGVWLAMGPIHTDILFPLDDALRSDLAGLGLPLSSPLAEWLSVGWGSQEFYTATGTYADLDFGTVWTAAVGDAAVMRFAVTAEIEPAPGLRWVEMSPRQLHRLRASVLQDRIAGPQLDAHLSANDAFVPAAGRFNLFRTCNTWVGQKFRSAGLRFGRWTPLTWSVLISAPR